MLFCHVIMTHAASIWERHKETRYFLVFNTPFFLLPIRVTGVPYSSAEIAVHFPVPFCPALSRILGSKCVPSESLYFKMLAVISIRKESSSVLFQSSKTCKSFNRPRGDEIQSASLFPQHFTEVATKIHL